MESRATRAWDGVAICDPQVERNVRNDMPTGWSGVSLSDVPGRDSRAFKSSAYMVALTIRWAEFTETTGPTGK